MPTTPQNRKPAPEGFHYMPDGTLMSNHSMGTEKEESYTPLLIIIGLIFLASLVSLLPDWDLFTDVDLFRQWMGRFMAGFFLVFSGFKLIDVAGFTEGYATYDLLAKRIPVYGRIYPFLELALGLGYLITPTSLPLNLSAALLLGFSAIGVMRSLRANKPIKCACLGTALNIPLSNITVVEDIGMAAMAILMIIL